MRRRFSNRVSPGLRLGTVFGYPATTMRAVLLALGLGLLVIGCGQQTGRLDADQGKRLADQGIVRRANDLTFRHTWGGGTRWDDRRASIVVTRGTILIHQNGAVEFLLEPSSRRFCEVHRNQERVRISAGTGASAEAWSFEPPGDPQGWATDIRKAIRAANSRPSPN